MNVVKRRGVIVVLLVLLLAGEGFAQGDTVRSYQLGRSLFITNCSPCHGIHKEKTGPMLASITKKRSAEWLMAFIRDSQSVIVLGDDYAGFLFRQYNHQVMPSFRQLSNGEIAGILRYIGEESVNPTEALAYAEDVRQSGTPEVLEGRAIFNAQCASCHAVGREAYGPALGSVNKRRPASWLVSFIRNSQQVIQSGDPYANHIYNAFDQRLMVPMEFLSQDDIRAILAYIGFASASAHSVAGVNGRKMVSNKHQPTLAAVSLYNVHEEKHSFRIYMIVLALGGACIHGFLVVKLFKYLNKGQRS